MKEFILIWIIYKNNNVIIVKKNLYSTKQNKLNEICNKYLIILSVINLFFKL